MLLQGLSLSLLLQSFYAFTSKATHSAVRTYHSIPSVSLSFYESYPKGVTSASTSLIPHLAQAVILPQHDAFVGLKRFG